MFPVTLNTIIQIGNPPWPRHHRLVHKWIRDLDTVVLQNKYYEVKDKEENKYRGSTSYVVIYFYLLIFFFFVSLALVFLLSSSSILLG